ncbi:MAG: hypothetical protein AAGD25_32185 [Cyanobacteria bacterium P01_F01_bin.150]
MAFPVIRVSTVWLILGIVGWSCVTQVASTQSVIAADKQSLPKSLLSSAPAASITDDQQDDQQGLMTLLSLTVDQAKDITDLSQRLNILEAVVAIYRDRGHPEKGAIALESFIADISNHQDLPLTEYLQASRMVAQIYQDLGRSSQVIAVLDTAVAQLDRQDFQNSLASDAIDELIQIAAIYGHLDQRQQGMDQLERAMVLAASDRVDWRKAGWTIQIADVYGSALDAPKKRDELLAQALPAVEAIAAPSDRISALIQLAYTYIEAGQEHQANDCFRLAIAAALEMPIRFGRPEYLIEIAETYEQLGDRQRANALLASTNEMLKAYIENPSEPDGAIFSDVLLAMAEQRLIVQTYVNWGEDKQALALLLSTISTVETFLDTPLFSKRSHNLPAENPVENPDGRSPSVTSGYVLIPQDPDDTVSTLLEAIIEDMPDLDTSGTADVLMAAETVTRQLGNPLEKVTLLRTLAAHHSKLGDRQPRSNLASGLLDEAKTILMLTPQRHRIRHLSAIALEPRSSWPTSTTLLSHYYFSV